MLTRRQGLTTGAALLAASAVPKATFAAPASRVPRHPPDLGFLSTTPLVNADRLRREMDRAGLDAVVTMQPGNVFYLSNHWPQLDRMGFRGAGIAIFPRDPSRPLALVMHAFLYYYTHTPESDFADRLVFPYTQPEGALAPGGDEPAAAVARTMRVADPQLETPLDRHRARMFGAARAPSADASWALVKALAALGLTKARLGVDHPELTVALGARGFAGSTAPGENVVRRARLAKSTAEIKLMRLAACANAEAAMAAAIAARDLGSTSALRARFFAEAAQRGNSGQFMVIGGVSSEVVDQPLRDGMAISIDCVSTCRFYHGDFGRTVFVGEPRAPIVRALDHVATAWNEVRDQLRPGLRFADVQRIGREALRKLDPTLSVSFTPHSVGLHHTDHPGPSLVDAVPPEALMLERDMVLSVDCPVFVAGLGGTAHFEDLMLIRDGPAEAIHPSPPAAIII